MMLRELEAFEACWLDLKDTYPTSSQDNILITHAMGQLVDLLEKPAQVEQNLPDHLKVLFRQLALAYFQGYLPQAERPSEAHSPQPVVPQSPPPSDQQRRQEITTAVNRIKTLAQKTEARLQQHRGQTRPCPLSEMETLVIDFPEHWQAAIP
jgi:hypothetical protein